MRQELTVNEESSSKHNFVFWLHVMITTLAWLGPFLFTWYLLIGVFLIVMIQFMIYDRCLMNTTHDLNDYNDTTIYSYVIEKLGYNVNRGQLKLWVRQYFYVILSAVAIFWQVIMGIEPLLF